jgi:hypothetical protein
LEVVRAEPEQPPLEEVLGRIKSRGAVSFEQSSAEMIRELREEMG